MKFKKTMTALLAAGMILSFAACTPGESPSGNPSSSSAESKPSGETKKPESAKEGENGGDSSAEANSAFGKVAAAAGNEITLKLATPPVTVDLEITTGSGEGDAGEEPKGGGNDGMIRSDGFTVAGGGEEGGGAQRPQMVLEYTGEEKEFVIPAGTPIKNHGTDETMDAIQKGSVVMIHFDDSGNIESIDIWE